MELIIVNFGSYASGSPLTFIEVRVGRNLLLR